ncbi:hypothetical protein [Streptomyces sp. NK08204]|uniref:hypothetical protein n=1 Tax=Streptomyces sp. NK08204 TaxID=2873260 RepID=UPI001CECA051|nr:hypothetical protein [Streptomyces sp. NK08204]
MHQRHPLPTGPARHTVARGSATLAALAALTLATAGLITSAPAAHAAPVPAAAPAHGTGFAPDTTDQVQYAQDDVYAAGDLGYLHRRANADGSPGPYTWHAYDGTEQTLASYGGALPGQYGYYGNGSDTLLTSPQYSGGQAQLRNTATGATVDVTVPDGQYVAAAFGSTVITQEYNDVWQIARLHLLHVTDTGEITSDIPVDPPSDQFFPKDQAVLAGDGTSALVRFRHATAIGLLDLSTGALTSISTHATDDDPVYLQAALSPTHIAVYHEGASQARVVRRDDPTGAQTAVNVPQSTTGTAFIGLTGEWLLTTYRPPAGTTPGPGGPLLATPLSGGTPLTLLPSAGPQIAQIPAGGAIAVGEAADGTWTAHVITTAPNGRPTAQPL